MLISNFILSGLSFLLDNNSFTEQKSTRVVQYILVVFIFIYLIGNFLSLPPVTSIYLPEIIPGKGYIITYIFNWLNGIYILLVFPIVK
jgi:hypothetical protein